MILKPEFSEFDAACTYARPGDIIVLGSGTYTTRGNWGAGKDRAWCQANGVYIVGQGSDRTRILLKDPVMEADGVIRPDRDLNVLWCIGNTEIRGVHIDGDWQSHGGWHVGGLRIRDGKYILDDVRVSGLRGAWHDDTTQSKEIEVFGVSSQGNTSFSHITRVRVDDVCPDSYVSGIYGGGDFGCKGSICTDSRVDLGGNNQFSFASNPGWTFRDCRGEGTKYGFYNDTGASGANLVGCRLTASYSAITLVAKVETDYRFAKVSNCELVAPRALELVDNAEDHIFTNVLLEGCRLTGTYVAAVDGLTAGSVVSGCVLVNPGTVRFRTAKSPPTVLVLNRWLDGSPANPPETVA